MGTFSTDIAAIRKRAREKLEMGAVTQNYGGDVQTAIAKAACNQVGFEVAHESIQAMGATGYSRETLVEYCMRRCRGWMIAGGSVEILKNRIAEHVFDRRFDQRGRHADAAE